MIERKLTPQRTEEDIRFDSTLRPKHLDEYVGQAKIKENLKVFISAAKQRGEALDHLLFYGPPGLGKTTLAYIISNELVVGIKATSGPVIERPGDLAAILTNLEERSVLFIDEIHRLNPVVEEILYSAMEDFQLDILIGQGPSAKTIKLDIPPFTLIGATTRTGLLSSPLRDRFGFTARLDYYGNDDLKQIVERSARILTIEVEPEGAWEIARRSRGTPRIANRLLRRVRDFAQVKGKGSITASGAKEFLEMMEVDEKGFDQMDRKILQTIIEKFGGGPVGLETLSAAISEEKDTIEEVYEPFLIQGGFLDRTPRGRMATRLAYEHFGRKYDGQQGKLLFLAPLAEAWRDVPKDITNQFAKGSQESLFIKIGILAAIIVGLYMALRIFWLLIGILTESLGGLKGINIGRSGPRKQADRKAENKDYIGAAEIYQSIGEMEKAAEMYEKGKAFNKAGEILLQLNRTDRAAQMYERGGDLDRAAQIYTKKGMYAQAGEIFMRTGKFISAAEMFEKTMDFSRAGELFAKEKEYHRAGQMFEKIKSWERGAEMFEKTYWEERLGMKDKFSSDIQLEMTVEKRKQLSNLAYKSAELYEKAGNHKKAISILSESGYHQKAAEIASASGELTLAAELYLKDGLSIKAAEIYDRLGDEKKAAQLRAETLKSQGDANAAAQAFEKAGQLIQSVELYRSIGKYQEAGRLYVELQEYAQAGEMLLKAKDLKSAAEAYGRGRDFTTSAAIYQRLGDDQRQSEMLELGGYLYEAAVNYYSNGKFDEALEVLHKIGEESPDFPRASVLLGDIYQQKGQLTQSISSYKRVLSNKAVTKAALPIFYSFALALEKHGDKDQAVELYEKIIKQDSLYADVVERLEGLKKEEPIEEPTEEPSEEPTEVIKRPAAPPSAEAPQEEGRFTLLKVIGRGGMGTVYKAKDNVLDRPVALKIIEKSVAGSADMGAHFLREARAAAKLIHPNIVTVFDADQDEETSEYYIVMELVEGMTVKQILTKNRKLPLEEVLMIGKQVCVALDFAHSRNVIHRDIKNSNILWTADKVAKLMDFGLARVIQEISSFQTIVGGTPHYMSPEQVLGNETDARSDIYSLGISLFEMLTGQVPFLKGDIGYHHLHTPAPSPRTLVPEIPEGIEKVILRCLEKDPEKRFQSAKELLAALESIPK